MHLTNTGEIKLSTTTLGTRHDQQVGKSRTVHTEESFRTFFFPFRIQSSATGTRHHVKGRGFHPLKTGCVNKRINRVFNAIMDHASFVNFAHTGRCRINQVNIRSIK